MFMLFIKFNLVSRLTIDLIKNSSKCVQTFRFGHAKHNSLHTYMLMLFIKFNLVTID